MVNTNTLAAIGVAVGGIGVIVSAYTLCKMYKADKKVISMANRLNATLDEVSDSIDFNASDISEAIIEEATNKAVDKAAKEAAKAAVEKVSHTFDDDIRDCVRRAVEDEKAGMKAQIKDQIDKEIGHIDISEAKREVLEAAKQTAAEKFNADLDGILANHNAELKNIQTIYSSIAKSMKGD